MNNKITKIVLTGGPCAGKTTAMERIVSHFTAQGITVLVVPEVATMFAQSGVDFATPNRQMFLESERQLLEFQMELEDRYVRIAQQGDRPALIVCDRGTMDVAAYMSNDMWQALLDGMSQSVTELRDGRYDAVIHMTTAAKGAIGFYTLSNNTARRESPEEAIELDDRLLSQWVGHPHLRVVPNESGFEAKLQQVVELIAQVLGIPIPIEVERKYLVEVIGTIPMCDISEIYQTYLSPIGGKEMRLRKRGKNGHYIYYQTTKTYLAEDRRIEYEEQITPWQYLELMQHAHPERGTVEKRRCCFLYENQYFELDTFCNPPLDYALLEIEDADDPTKVKFPPFLKVIKDVTDDPNYHNSYIARLVKHGQETKAN